jgi:hypothetical protein
MTSLSSKFFGGFMASYEKNLHKYDTVGTGEQPTEEIRGVSGYKPSDLEDDVWAPLPDSKRRTTIFGDEFEEDEC